ncbi:MAG: DUF1810 family protein [Rhizomicrobium sp.]
MDDPYNLKRFLDAQAPVIEQVRAELRAGCKRGHWMWFVFPQIVGLGHSDMARFIRARTRVQDKSGEGEGSE